MHIFPALSPVPALIASAGAPSIADPAGLLQGLGPAALAVIAVMVFIESGVLFPFLPGDSLLFTAGLLHRELHLTLPVLIGVVATAAVAGDQVGYMLGRTVGRKWFREDARVLKTSHLNRAEEFFDRHGGAAIVMARFVPIVRTYAPLAAGIARYRYRAFTLWNISGALAWAVSVTLLGTWLGRFEVIANNIDVIAVAMVLLSVLPWGIELLKRRRDTRASAREDTGDEQPAGEPATEE